MDGNPLGSTGLPIRTELIDAQVTATGLIRTRYRVINESGPKVEQRA